jgi:peptidoglycan hydrolase-like protein with peptidoglycan-binding domain
MAAVSGSEFLASLPERATAEREELIVEAVLSGLHLPLIWLELPIRVGHDECIFFVLDDAIRIGVPGDWLRINVTARGQQRIADALGASLPTAELVEAAYDQGIKLSPCFQTPDAEMANTSRMLRHSREVDDKIGGRSGLVAGNVGKHWVLHERLEGLVVGGAQGAANFGWFQAKVRPYAPVQTLGFRHNLAHVDYSQVCWLVRKDVLLNGTRTTLEAVLTHPTLHRLASSTRLSFTRLPGVPKPGSEPAGAGATGAGAHAGTAANAGTTTGGNARDDDPRTWPTLRLRSKGRAVAAWQRQLMNDGHDLSPWNDDGDFGSMTHNATVSWQRSRGLPATGVVGPDTVALLVDAPLPPPATTLPVIQFVPAANFTPANRSDIRWIVLHTMEAAEASTTAENVARWFAGRSGPAPQASAHYCIDDNSIVQCVKDHDVAWHAKGGNRYGIGLEHAGYARQTAEEWADAFSQRMLTLSAALSAELCRRHNIPVTYVDAAGLLSGARGITTHLQITKAFKESTHTDPGKWFPMERYLELIRGS